MALQLSREWRQRVQRYQLVGGRCSSCGRLTFPRRPVCPDCGSEKSEDFRFSGRGEVYSYATMYKAPVGFEQDIPYVVALVKLAEGPLITAELTDVEESDVSIGMPVEAVTRRWREHGPDGPIVYGYKFRPLLRPVSPG